jgi:SAM-dependent methyltransferase
MTSPINDYSQRVDVYDLDCADRSDDALLVRMVNKSVRSALEIPCGTGRKAITLAELGVQVVGVDREQLMIERFRQRLAAMEDPPDVTPVVGDMRNLKLGRRFDLIAVMREAFQLLTDVDDARRALASFRQHTAFDGKIVLDLASFAPVSANCSNFRLNWFDPDLADNVWVEDYRDQETNGAIVTRWHRQWDLGGSVIEAELAYRVIQCSGARSTSSARLRARRYGRNEFETLLESAGFRTQEVYADYSLTPFVEGSSRMIFLAVPY